MADIRLLLLLDGVDRAEICSDFERLNLQAIYEEIETTLE